jgi:hypothetical protein
MRKTRQLVARRWTRSNSCAAVGVMFVAFGTLPSSGLERASTPMNKAALPDASSAMPAKLPSDAKAGTNQSTIPPGTILPVILRTTIAPEKMREGETIRGEIAQDVPLPSGAKIRKGSKVEGHVIEVVAAGNGNNAKISIRFDKVYSHGQAIPVKTNLRALAGFMDVQDAGLPQQAPGEGDVHNWWTTTQVGGESVYGAGGPVMSAEDASKVVGKSVNDGVLVQVRAKEGTKCRGAIDGNNDPQALWVFSSDGCGIYGISNVEIAHAGRTEPVGTIVLEMQGRNTKIRSAAGMLLRVTR